MNYKRKKPYKLRDHQDAIIGMKIWHYSDNNHSEGIRSGTVLNIGSCGELMAKMDTPNPNIKAYDEFWGHFTAYRTCFSSYNSALEFKTKCDIRRSKRGW